MSSYLEVLNELQWSPCTPFEIRWLAVWAVLLGPANFINNPDLVIVFLWYYSNLKVLFVTKNWFNLSHCWWFLVHKTRRRVRHPIECFNYRNDQITLRSGSTNHVQLNRRQYGLDKNSNFFKFDTEAWVRVNGAFCWNPMRLTYALKSKPFQAFASLKSTF